MNVSLDRGRDRRRWFAHSPAISRCWWRCASSPACCAGGIFPVGMAMIGDLVPVEERQVAIGRLLAVGLTGNLIGATISGVIGDLFGWRGVFFTLGGVRPHGRRDRVLRFSRHCSIGKPRPFNIASAVPPDFGHVCRSPRQGLLRFGVLRRHRHPRHVSLCGAAVAGGRHRRARPMPASSSPGSGSAASSIHCRCRFWSKHVTERHMMLAGAACACIAFVLISFNFVWYIQAAYSSCSASASTCCTTASRSTSPT